MTPPVTHTRAETRAETLAGIALMTAAMAGFALADAALKLLSLRMPVGQIMLAYGAGGALCLLLATRARRLRVWTRAAFLPAVLCRNAAEMAGTFCFISALSLIPLSTATAILQATPLVYLAAAGPVFGLRVTRRQWLAVGAGFLGVMLILRPGTAGFDANALWAVGAVLALALRDLATRRVPRDVPSLTLSFWGFLSLVPVGLAWTAWGGAIQPTVAEQALVLAAVVCGICAYFAITVAVRRGDPGAVTPFRYTRLVFGLALGALVFAETPDAPALAGALVVVVSGVSVLVRPA